jgi:hypothetical protein
LRLPPFSRRVRRARPWRSMPVRRATCTITASASRCIGSRYPAPLAARPMCLARRHPPALEPVCTAATVIRWPGQGEIAEDIKTHDRRTGWFRPTAPFRGRLSWRVEADLVLKGSASRYFPGVSRFSRVAPGFGCDTLAPEFTITSDLRFSRCCGSAPGFERSESRITAHSGKRLQDFAKLSTEPISIRA